MSIEGSGVHDCMISMAFGMLVLFGVCVVHVSSFWDIWEARDTMERWAFFGVGHIRHYLV